MKDVQTALRKVPDQPGAERLENCVMLNILVKHLSNNEVILQQVRNMTGRKMLIPKRQSGFLRGKNGKWAQINVFLMVLSPKSEKVCPYRT